MSRINDCKTVLFTGLSNFKICDVAHELCALYEAEIQRKDAALNAIDIRGPDGDGLVWIHINPDGCGLTALVRVGNEPQITARTALAWQELRRNALAAYDQGKVTICDSAPKENTDG